MTEREIIEQVAREVEGNLYEGYSGRNMFGARCLGITCRSPIAAIEAAAALGLRGARQDNLGLSYIVYWPKVKERNDDENDARRND